MWLQEQRDFIKNLYVSIEEILPPQEHNSNREKWDQFYGGVNGEEIQVSLEQILGLFYGLNEELNQFINSTKKRSINSEDLTLLEKNRDVIKKLDELMEEIIHLNQQNPNVENLDDF